jgi:hypothetical protein
VRARHPWRPHFPSGCRTEDLVSFGTVLVHLKELARSPNPTPIVSIDLSGLVCHLNSDHMLLKQLLCTIINLVAYNDLDFKLAGSLTAKAAVREGSVLAISCSFSDSWYAWQDSNLRPVAPEAVRSFPTISVSLTFSMLSSQSGYLLSLAS